MARSADDQLKTPKRGNATDPTGALSSVNRSERRTTSGSRRVSMATVASREAAVRRPETPLRTSTGGDLADRSVGSRAPSQYDIEQWMKLLRNNRINAENSWNFPLIDYFHDIVKDGNGINFQKASYTLDGCVKVYTTRVDSLVAKTTRLLSGLVGSEVVEEEEVNADEQDDDLDPNASPRPKQRKKRGRKTATCVANPRSLDVDLEKFRQLAGATRNREDFDEGGTIGTQLWKGTTDSKGWIGGRHYAKISDLPAGQPESQEVQPEDQPEDQPAQPEGKIADVTFFRTTYLTGLENRSVHPSAEAIGVAIQDPQLSTAALVEGVQGWTLSDPPEPEQYDAESNAPNILDDNDLDYDHLSDAFSMQGTEIDADADEQVKGDGVDWGVMQYFEQNKAPGWAGPSHWRVGHYHTLRGGLPGSSTFATPAKGAEAKEVPKRRRKEPIIIDFSAPVPEGDILFETGSGIDMRPSQRSQAMHTLPTDYHVTSKQLTRVFARPDDGPAAAVEHAHRYHRERVQAADAEDQEMELNDDFWGQMNSDAPMLYDADFYQDQDDDVPTSNDLPVSADVPMSSANFNGIAALSQSRRNDQITYARVARNVDVQQLKTTMWDTLQTTSEQHPSDTLTLSTVMHDTAEKYTPDKQKELSTPFYFICLLHLANEQGLTLNSTPDLGDLEIAR